jgi:hypothetical protein
LTLLGPRVMIGARGAHRERQDAGSNGPVVGPAEVFTGPPGMVFLRGQHR